MNNSEYKTAKAVAKANRPWYRKKRYWLGGFVALVLVGSALSSGGDESEPVAGEATAAEAPPTKGKEKAEEKAEPEPEPAPAKWVTVTTLSGSTNKSGPNFHLNGCETRLSYDLAAANFAMAGIYVMEDGTTLDSDGGFPEVMPDKAGKGQTILRKDEGDYYLDVQAANTDWTVKVEERC